MPLHSYAVLIAFVLLGIILGVMMAAFHQKGALLLGKPTLDKFYFYSGKISLFLCWGLFLLKALLPTIGYIDVPVYVSWAGVALLYFGCTILTLSFLALGDALKVGLPVEQTNLKTGGIYQYSRNPLYMGTHIICLASCTYFPDLLNVTFAVYGIIIHHKIVQGEETFLARRFGSEWDAYCNKVRRYL
jgi:protein-S-isoprenylcysteine O-methyltransferase Ste14